MFDYVNNTIDTISDEGGDDSDAVAALEPNRVNLMTIHASKGLQFNHVLLPFMDKSPNKTKTEIFSCDIDQGKFGLSIPVGEEQKKTPPISSKSVIEKEKLKQLEEGDRVLYVALTRAKKSVFLSWNEELSKDCWAMRVSLPVSEATYQTSNYSYKVERGPWQPETIKTQNRLKSVARQPFLPRQSKHIKQEKISVSLLLEEGNFYNLDKTKDNIEQSIVKTQFGVLLHYCMEILKQDFNYDFTQLAQFNFDQQEAEVLQAIEYVRELKQPDMKYVITEGEVEWGFQFLQDGQIIEGQIDLWGQDQNGVTWVIDYKSGSPKHSARAFAQLSIYAKALINFAIKGEIKLAVVYPLHQQVKIQEFNPV